MNLIWRFLRFWYEFVVGDDVWIAVGVAAALATTALLTRHYHRDAWWFLPAITFALLVLSVVRVAWSRRARLKRQSG